MNLKHLPESRLLRIAGAILMAVLLAMLATVPLNWKDQAILGGVIFLVAVFINRRFSGHQATVILMLVSLFCTSRYFWWRVSETTRYLVVNGSQTPALDIFFVTLLLGAEAYSVVILVLGFFQSARPLRRCPVPMPEDIETWPVVDVYIPTYNEPLDVVRTTILAATNMDWPPDRLNVYVLDDGRRSEIHKLAQEAGCGYIARLDNVGAKAGNINNALQKTSGEYVAIFDSDHVPTRSFLQLTMGWFLRDARLGLVQTPHHFYSADPFERNLGTFRHVPNEGELFYGVLQDGNDFWNATFFCGSCAVLRRAVLDEIGGIATETVTEDSHTALRLQRRGWNTAYLNLPQAAGLATANLSDHIGQRIRWARGMVQILRFENPLFGRGLTWPQRLCYFNAVVHYLHALPRLIFLTAPLVYLLLGRSNLYGYVWAILAYVFPHLLLATLTNSRVHGSHRHSFWNEVFETILAPYILLPTLLALLNPRWGKFNVTPKRTIVTKAYFDLPIASPFLLLLGLNVAGLVAAYLQWSAGVDDNGTLLVNMMWTVLNVLILGATLAVPWEIRQLRAATRVDLRMPFRLRTRTGQPVTGVTLNLSMAGGGVQMDDPLDLRPGEPAELIFATEEGDFVFPVEVKRSVGLRVALQFTFTKLAEYEALTRIIFGRADSWIAWAEGRQEDRLLRSLGRLLFISARGIAMVPKGLISGPEAEPRVSQVPATPSVPARTRALPLTGILLAWFLLSAGVARADEPFRESRDLAELGHRLPILFRAGEGRANLHFVVPMTNVVTRAALVLNYRSSGGFREGSNLNISLNGVGVGSTPALSKSGESGLQRVEMLLPADLMVSDNTLTLQMSATCQGGCKENAHWLEVDPATSIQIFGTMLPLPNDLRVLPAPFIDSSLRRLCRIPIVFAEAPRREALEAAGVVASWLGKIADDRGTQFPVRVGTLQKGDAIVIAVNSSAIAHTLNVERANGPALALRTNPLDPFGKLLVITGSNPGELRIAAQALASGAYAKEGDWADVAGFRLPAASVPYDAPRWLNPLHPAGLGEALSPEQLRWYGAGAVSLYFRLPPDLAFGQRSTVPLRLHFRTVTTGDQRAELRVNLNGSRVSATRLNLRDGTSIQHQTVYLPVTALYPSNTVTAEFVLNPQKGEGSERYPEISVLPNSSIDLQDIPRFVQLPRLDLFVQAGFPFTRLADLSGTAVILPDTPSLEELSLYLGMAGRFGAQTGQAGLRVMVVPSSQVEQAREKELLVIGSPTDQPLLARWSDQLPVRFDGALRPRRPSGLWGLLADIQYTPIGREYRRLSDVLFDGSQPDGILQGIVSPLNGKHNAVLLVASEQPGFETLMQALVNPSANDVKGSVSLLSNTRFQSFQIAGNANYVGQLSWLESFYNWVGRNFYLIVVALIGCAIPLARWFSSWSDQQAVWRLEHGR